MTLKTTAGIVLTVCSLMPFGADAAGDIEAGKTKSTACAACHGKNAQQNPGIVIPNIGGQYADYLAKALKDYRSGARKNTVMTGMAAGLSDQDIADLSAYYASLEGLSVVKRP